MIYPSEKKDSNGKSTEIKLEPLERAELIWRNIPATNKPSDKIQPRNRH